jgi:hypothetical protein
MIHIRSLSTQCCLHVTLHHHIPLTHHRTKLQKYAAVAGVDIPNLSDSSKSDLKQLGAELASTHAMEKVAWAMGKDLGWEAAKVIQEQMGDAMLRRIGIEPSPELNDAFAQFYAEAQRFTELSRKAAEAQGLIERQEAEASFLNVTRTADRIAATMEGVNVTEVLLTATQLMIEAEPYLNDAIAQPVQPEARVRWLVWLAVLGWLAGWLAGCVGLVGWLAGWLFWAGYMWLVSILIQIRAILLLHHTSTTCRARARSPGALSSR